MTHPHFHGNWGGNCEEFVGHSGIIWYVIYYIYMDYRYIDCSIEHETYLTPPLCFRKFLKKP